MKKLRSEKSIVGASSLRRAIQLALASTVLASGVSHAVLRDHGPIRTSSADPTLPADFFPDWYRENADAGGMAVGQCIFADDAGNGPLCLTSTANATAGRFAGNIGPEAFYATADIAINFQGGASLLWMGHLEMAYLTADGEPPAVRDAANPQEVVFSRERIRVDLPVQGGACTGTYTIRTPFSVRDYDMQEGNRALFFTDDKTPIPGNYQAVLKGHTGPFLKWDVGLDNNTPVSVDNPAVIFTPVSGTPRKYIGDPNIPHLFVGSTIPAGLNHPEKGFNNYVEITPPAGCNLTGNVGDEGAPVYEDLAAISGRIWDLPIQDPVSVTKATYVRNGTTSALDVWAEANSNQNIVLTASNNNSQHMPSLRMPEEIIAGSKTGRYHAHVEFDNTKNIPSEITVTNLTSAPASRASSAVVDAVVVTKSTYDPVSRRLCVAAHSGDETSPVPLSLESPGYGALTAPTTNCTAVVGNDLVLDRVLDNVAASKEIPPVDVIVRSDLGGSETTNPVSLTGTTDAVVLPGAVDDLFERVQGTSTTQLDLAAASFDNPPNGLKKTTAGADTLPLNHRIVVISQPQRNIPDPGNPGSFLTVSAGTVTAPATGSTVTYQAVEGMDSTTSSFYYAIQNTDDGTVTNVARVDMSIVKVTPPPVTVKDDFLIFRTGGARTFNPLTNDVPGPSNSPIDAASVKLVSPGAGFTLSANEKTLTTPRGSAVVNANGTITYTPNAAQNGTANNTIESFGYTVANNVGSRTGTQQINVVYRTAAETFTPINRIRPNGTTWTIRFPDSWGGQAVGGPVGTTAPSATCRVTRNNGVNGEFGQIGAPATWTVATGLITIQGTGPAVTGAWLVTCTSSNGNSFTSGQV